MTAVNEKNILELVAEETRAEAQAPRVATREASSEKLATSSAGSTVVGTAPFDGVVSKITYAPVAGINVDASNYRSFTVLNKGSANLGSATVATGSTKAATWPAYTATALTLSATASELVVKAGDIIEFESAAGAGSKEDPSGEVIVSFARKVKEAAAVTTEPLKAQNAAGYVGSVPTGA